MFHALINTMLAGLFMQSSLLFFLANPFTLPPAHQLAIAPTRLNPASLGIATTAKSVLVLDNASGAVLFEKNSDAVLPIASITKLMTAYLVSQAKPDWGSVVIVTEADRRGGDIDRIIPGERLPLRDLFGLMLVASNNDATTALARSVGSGNFVDSMNEQARTLGMVHTTFTDPTGLEPTNVSSVADLALLARAVFSVDEIRSAALISSYQFTPLGSTESRIAPATDQLLHSFLNEPPYEIIGAKTGFLDEAGYCLVLQLRRDGHDIIIALLGAANPTSRWQEAKGLADWTFANYQWH